MKPTVETPKYSLYLGDCLDVMREMEAGCVDAVVTDPPYGVGIEYGEYFEDTRENLEKLLNQFIPEAVRVSRGAVIFPSGSLPTEIWLYQQYPPKWRICWYKGAQSTLSAIGFCDWEMLMVYGNKVHNHVHDYFFAKTEPATNGHPCPKSIRWATWLVGKFTKNGNTVFDPFAGSGTTGVACMQLGRRFIGVEIDERYFSIAERRIREAAMQEPLFTV